MEIYSDSGYLIIMDPHYLELGDEKKIKSINFLENPIKSATILENNLFPDGATEKIGLIILPDGPGKYHFDLNQVSFWDVEEKSKKNKTIFGVELGSFILFDIKYIQDIINDYDKFELKKIGEEAYFDILNRKISKDGKAIIWSQSHVGIGDGWHEVKWRAFKKC